MSFSVFLYAAKGCVFVNLPLWHDHSERIEEWNLLFCQEVSFQKVTYSAWEKRTKRHDWPTSSGCGATRRKCLLRMDTFPRPVHTQAFIHYYPSCQLAYSSATKLLHPSLSLASLWMVPQLWFIFFISASTALHQVVFSQPCLPFPSGVQWMFFI